MSVVRGQPILFTTSAAFPFTVEVIYQQITNFTGLRRLASFIARRPDGRIHPKRQLVSKPRSDLCEAASRRRASSDHRRFQAQVWSGILTGWVADRLYSVVAGWVEYLDRFAARWATEALAVQCRGPHLAR